MWVVMKDVLYWMQTYIVEILKLYLLTRFVLGGIVKCRDKKVIFGIHTAALLEIIVCVSCGFSQNLENRIQSIIFIIYITVIFCNILYGFLSYFLITVIDFGIGLFYIWVFEIKYQSAYESYIFSLIVGISSLLLLATVAFFRKKRKQENDRILEKRDYVIGNILLLGILSCGVPIMDSIFQTAKIQRRGQAIIGVIMIVLVVWIWIQRYRKIQNEKNEYVRELQAQEKYLEQQKDYYNALLKKEHDTKKFRHDIKQQLRCIYELEEQDKKKELHEYLLEVLSTVNEIKVMISTGNEIVNAVANDIFQDTGISIEWKGLLPSELRMKQSDICVLFANLFKNAKEAVLQTEKNQIWIDIKQYKGNVNITIKNPVAEKKEIIDGNILTTKEEQDRHGFGLENIRHVVGVYNGVMEIICDDECFEVNLLFHDIV